MKVFSGKYRVVLFEDVSLTHRKKELAMKKVLLAALFCCGVLASSSVAFAHSALCACMDNGDQTVTCEGGFSDGSSAAGVVVRVVDKEAGKTITYGKMNEDGEYTFDKPSVPYKVVMDGGEGHTVEIEGDSIIE